MNPNTTYHIILTGDDEQINAANEFLRKSITDKRFVVDSDIIIRQTQSYVYSEEVIELARGLAGVSPALSFIIKGFIDTADSAGELMDFEIKFEAGRLTAAFSDWYIDTLMSSYDSYEDFCDFFFECDENEYNVLKNNEFAYIIETDDGDILAAEIPLKDPVIIEL